MFNFPQYNREIAQRQRQYNETALGAEAENKGVKMAAASKNVVLKARMREWLEFLLKKNCIYTYVFLYLVFHFLFI